MRYTPSTKTNPCPVCAKTNGNCRTTENDLVLCMTYQDDDYRHLGYRFRKTSKCGLWGIYVPITEDDQDYSYERKQAYQLAKQARENARLEALKGGLSIEERDRNIRLVHKHLGLSKKDRQKLRDRGLTDEQIDKGLFFSVKSYQEIPEFIDQRLPGVFIGRNGKPMLKGDKKGSIACVAFADGKAIGWQCRHPRKENKYTWSKGIKSSHLNNGELPITHLVAHQDHKTLWLTEGILKPCVTHSEFNLNVAGASGFNFTGASQQIIKIVEDYKYDRVILAVDAGACENRHVMVQINKNIKLFTSLGCEVEVAWWGQKTKASPDIDELDSLDRVVFISVNEFREIANKALYEKKKSDTLNELTKYSIDKLITKDDLVNGKYLNPQDLIRWVDEHEAVAIKLPKGMGKTTATKALVEYWMRQNKPVILIGSRRILTRSQAGEFKIFSLVGDDKNEFNCSIESIIDEYSGVAIVVDSSLILEGVDVSNALLLVDEAEQFCNHTLTANTAIKDNRAKILSLLEDKLSQAQKVLLLDADLSNQSCDWFSGVSNKSIFKVGTQIKNQSANCYLVDEEKQLNQITIKKLKRGQKVTIVSDSRRNLEALQIEIEKQVSNVRDHVELITSETTTESFTQDFMSNCDRAIEDYQTYCLMFSPVAQSGISIDTRDYFDCVIGYCLGVIEPSTMRQLLMRVRDNCDRYLYIAPKPTAKYQNIFDYRQVMKDDNLNSLVKHYTDYKQGLIDAGHDEIEVESILTTIKNLDSSTNTNIHEVTRAKLKARHNCLMSDYKNNLINELKAEGYNVINSSGHKGETDLKETKAEILVKEAELIYQAEPLPPEKIKHFEPVTKKEKAIVTKSIIVDTLPKLQLSIDLIVTEFLKKRWENITAVKRYWYIQNKNTAKEQDRKQYHYAVSNYLEGNQFWIHDSKFYSHFLKLFDILGLSKLINDNLPINKDSEQITAFYDGCKKYRSLLKKCSITFSNKLEPIQLLGKILKLFSFKLKGKRTRVDGNRIYQYKIVKVLENDIYQQIWSSFDYKLSSETITRQCLESVLATPNIINNQTEVGRTRLNQDIELITDDENDKNNSLQLDELDELDECEFTFVSENEPIPNLPDGFFDDEPLLTTPPESVDNNQPLNTDEQLPAVEPIPAEEGTGKPTPQSVKGKSFAERYYLNKVVDYCSLKIDQIFRLANHPRQYRLVGYYNGGVFGLSLDLDPYECNFKDALGFDPHGLVEVVQ